MITWGLKVNEYGNAFLDENGEFVKISDQGATDGLWAEMVAYAKSKNLKAGDYKKLNLPFENKLLSLPREIRERMCKGVEEFVYELLTEVFNAGDTAPLAVDAILKAGSYDLWPKAERIEDPGQWSEAKIKERASRLKGENGPKGNFDD
jgi:fructose-bisphosphate aldolase class II